jgi:hypothetical protein
MKVICLHQHWLWLTMKKGTTGKVGKKSDDAGFSDLINEALSDRYILRNEAHLRNKIRKDYRNVLCCTNHYHIGMSLLTN